VNIHAQNFTRTQHQQSSTTISNHQQSSTTISNHQQSSATISTLRDHSPLTTVKTLHRYETANALDTFPKHITSHNGQQKPPL
jgi:hypothetical protein